MGYWHDQAWGPDGWILAKFFFCAFMDRDGVEAHKHVKKKEQGQYPAILTKQAWSVKDLFFGMKHQKVILIVLVYLQVLKGKPVACKNQ